MLWLLSGRFGFLTPEDLRANHQDEVRVLRHGGRQTYASHSGGPLGAFLGVPYPMVAVDGHTQQLQPEESREPGVDPLRDGSVYQSSLPVAEWRAILQMAVLSEISEQDPLPHSASASGEPDSRQPPPDWIAEMDEESGENFGFPHSAPGHPFFRVPSRIKTWKTQSDVTQTVLPPQFCMRIRSCQSDVFAKVYKAEPKQKPHF